MSVLEFVLLAISRLTVRRSQVQPGILRLYRPRPVAHVCRVVEEVAAQRGVDVGHVELGVAGPEDFF